MSAEHALPSPPPDLYVEALISIVIYLEVRP